MYEDKTGKRKRNEELKQTEGKGIKVWRDKCHGGLHENRKKGNKNVHHESKRTGAKRYNLGL